MQTLSEKRVFGTKTGVTEVLVGTETGLVVATVSGAQIGTFGLQHRQSVTDLAVWGRELIVATDESVLVGQIEETAETPTVSLSAVEVPVESYAAVGIGPQGLLVGGAEAVAHTTDPTEPWTVVGSTGGVRAIDGGLIAAADGVYRFDGAGLTHVGLSDVADVDGRIPLAATREGLFRLANGWVSSYDQPTDRVASDDHDHHSLLGADGLYSTAGDGWERDELPVAEDVVAIAYGSGIRAAATQAGTLCVTAGDGWRHQRLGLAGVSAIAVAGDSDSSDHPG